MFSASTLIRVRRKRGAEPLEALVLSLKKARNDGEETPEPAPLAAGEAIDGPAPQRFLFSLFSANTKRQPQGVNVIDFNPPIAPVSSDAMTTSAGDDRMEGESMTEELSFVGDDSIGVIGGEKEEKAESPEEVLLCNGAALVPAGAVPRPEDDEEVFDFYRIAKDSDDPLFEHDAEWDIVVATKEEMASYIGAMDGVEESDVDDEDSNDENYFMNEYPDEESFSEGSYADDEDEEGGGGPRRRSRGRHGEEEECHGEYSDDEDGEEGDLERQWNNFRIG